MTRSETIMDEVFADCTKGQKDIVKGLYKIIDTLGKRIDALEEEVATETV